MSAVTVVGSCSLDLLVRVTKLPAPGETVLGGDVAMEPGGKGANQAVASHRLGADTALFAAIGTDQFGTRLRQALAGEGLDLRGLVTVDRATGVAFIAVDDDASNTVTVAPGANQGLSVDHLHGLRERLDKSSVLLLQLEIPVATCLAAATIARDVGARVLLNAAPIVDAADIRLAELMRLTDVLIVNESEAIALSPSRRLSSTERLRSLALKLGSPGPELVIMTLGESGALGAINGGTFVAPAYSVRALDSTGAGDAFCGAVAASLSSGEDACTAVERGCAAGALVTTEIGAQAGLPSSAEVERLIRHGTRAEVS